MLHVAATALGSPAVAQQLTTVQKNYTIVVDDDLVVRRLHPLPMFDDKGKPKKPTVEELRKLKGPDPKLKGYQAERADLKPGQIVVVTLAQTKHFAADATRGIDGKSSESGLGSRKPAYKIVGEYAGKLMRPPVPRVESKAREEDKAARETIVVGFESLRLPGQPAPAPRDKTRLPPTILVVRIMIVSESPDGSH
jgi:hypothetical protein